jgi:hypothetical protein
LFALIGQIFPDQPLYFFISYVHIVRNIHKRVIIIDFIKLGVHHVHYLFKRTLFNRFLLIF